MYLTIKCKEENTVTKGKIAFGGQQCKSQSAMGQETELTIHGTSFSLHTYQVNAQECRHGISVSLALLCSTPSKEANRVEGRHHEREVMDDHTYIPIMSFINP